MNCKTYADDQFRPGLSLVSFLLQIEMANRKGVEIPHGWGVDSTGQVRVTFVPD